MYSGFFNGNLGDYTLFDLLVEVFDDLFGDLDDFGLNSINSNDLLSALYENLLDGFDDCADFNGLLHMNHLGYLFSREIVYWPFDLNNNLLLDSYWPLQPNLNAALMNIILDHKFLNDIGLWFQYFNSLDFLNKFFLNYFVIFGLIFDDVFDIGVDFFLLDLDELLNFNCVDLGHSFGLVENYVFVDDLRHLKDILNNTADFNGFFLDKLDWDFVFKWNNDFAISNFDISDSHNPVHNLLLY